MEDLATQIREAMEAKGWSLRDVEHESARLGARVSFSTVSKILKGSYNPGERILQGISRALDLPIEKLREAAGVAEPGTPFRLPDYASRLSPEERSAIEHVVRVMVDAKDREKVMERGDPTPITQAAGSAATEEEKVARPNFRKDAGRAEDEELNEYERKHGKAAAPEETGITGSQNIDEH